MGQKKKVLVTGCSGLLGGALIGELKNDYDLYGLIHHTPNPDVPHPIHADITNHAQIKEIIKELKPQIIIHAAAATNVEQCEDDYGYARKVNALATLNLAHLTPEDCKLIYLSTDSVFDGNKEFYAEDDIPFPLNNYARTKLEGEGFVRQLVENHLIVRTNMFGWNRFRGQSLSEWIYSNLKDGKPIRMFTDVVFTPLCTTDLAFMIHKFLENDTRGIVNAASSNAMSKFDFGVKLGQAFNLNTQLIIPMSIDNFPFKAKRAKITSLNTAKLKKILLQNPPSIEDEIMRFRSEKELSA